jgi:hypothetical protein
MEHMLDHKPELLDTSKWAMIYATFGMVCAIVSFWAPAVFWIQLICLVVAGYYLYEHHKLHSHVKGIAGATAVMGAYLGLNHKDLQEIFNSVKHERTPKAK